MKNIDHTRENGCANNAWLFGWGYFKIYDMKTAMQELQLWAWRNKKDHELNEMFIKLLEKEKQQIKDAFENTSYISREKTAEDYYNETFKP